MTRRRRDRLAVGIWIALMLGTVCFGVVYVGVALVDVLVHACSCAP